MTPVERTIAVVWGFVITILAGGCILAAYEFFRLIR